MNKKQIKASSLETLDLLIAQAYEDGWVIINEVKSADGWHSVDIADALVMIPKDLRMNQTEFYRMREHILSQENPLDYVLGNIKKAFESMNKALVKNDTKYDS